MYSTLEVSLVACYARGGPRTINPSKSGALHLCRALRRQDADLSTASEAARNDGLWAESLLLQDEGLLEWASDALRAGIILTSESPAYPVRLRERLGPTAPPVFWKRYSPPLLPYIAVVGSREISDPVHRFAEEVAQQVTSLGFGLVSGGAKGVDRGAAAAVRRWYFPEEAPLAEVIPYGIRLLRPGNTCALSLAAPEEEFSGALAMERNLILYAMSEAAIVVEARFKEGGAWHGAVEALRRRLTRVLVRSDPGSKAHLALEALGAIPLESADALEEALRAFPLQAQLPY